VLKATAVDSGRPTGPDGLRRVFSATATIGADDRSCVAGLVAAAPMCTCRWSCSAPWSAVGQAGVNLYSMGLTLTRSCEITRVQSTGLVAYWSRLLVFLSQFVWDAESAVTTFVLVLTRSRLRGRRSHIGFRRALQNLVTADLRVFSQGRRGGRYWYAGGWNVNATVAWVVGSLAGCWPARPTASPADRERCCSVT
jgi:hypothetical protein